MRLESFFFLDLLRMYSMYTMRRRGGQNCDRTADVGCPLSKRTTAFLWILQASGCGTPPTGTEEGGGRGANDTYHYFLK